MLGPLAKIVGKSQGKRKNNALGKMTNFGLFSVLGWPYRAKKGVRVFTICPMFSVFFFCIFSLLCDHDLSLFYGPYLLNSSYFYYKYGTIQHAIHTILTHLTIHIPCCLHLLSRWSQNNTSAGTCDFSTKTKTARVTFQRRRRRQHFSLFPLVFTAHNTQHTTHSTLHSTRTQHSTHTQTVFLWIGPLFHWIGPPVSQDRTFS